MSRKIKSKDGGYVGDPVAVVPESTTVTINEIIISKPKKKIKKSKKRVIKKGR